MLNPNVVTMMYAITIFLTLLGIAFVIATIQTRKKVKKQYASDMAILADWDRALRYVLTGKEENIITAMDIIWAHSDPAIYVEVEPIVRLFLNHNNKNISDKAAQILKKQIALLSNPTPKE